MVKFTKIGYIEKLYPFEIAKAGQNILNGDFGEIEDGAFAPCANGSMVVMNEEVGDDMALDAYPIPEGAPVRVLNLAKIDGLDIEVYGAQLPDEVAVDDVLASNDEGKLETGASGAPCLTVKKIIGVNAGVVATVTAE